MGKGLARNKSIVAITLLLTIIVAACSGNKKTSENPIDVSDIYKKYGFKGAVTIFRDGDDFSFEHDSIVCKTRYSPASTFKIFNSLIALETGSLKDEYEILKTPKTDFKRDSWNHDQNLISAYKNSTVWFYQELARRVGKENYKTFFKLAKFGNQDIGDTVDNFWLNGKLQITPREQVDFLKKLKYEFLPFNLRNLKILKKIMLQDSGKDWKMYAKTGWTYGNVHPELGWWVGYVTTPQGNVFFASLIFKNDKSDEEFIAARKAILKEILIKLKMIE